MSRATMSIPAVFFINGLLFASLLPYIPNIKLSLALGDAQLGVALLGMAIGALIFMSLSTKLCMKFGSNVITRLAAFAFCFAVFLPVMADHLIALFLAFFIFGGCNGMMDVAMNIQALAVENQQTKKKMSFYHAFFSLGGLVGAASAGTALYLEVPTFTHLTCVSMIALLCNLLFTTHLLKGADEKPVDQSKGNKLNRHIILLCGFAFVVLMAEGAIADWSAVYFKTALHTSSAFAAIGYAAFSCAMMLGRFFGDMFVEGSSVNRVCTVSSLAASLGLVLGLTSENPWGLVLGLAFVGLGLSNLIPILFRIATSTHVSFVASAGYMGFMLGPPLIGSIAQISSLYISLMCIGAAIPMSTLIYLLFAKR